MKFFKSVVLAAAIASCSLYIVDAQTCAGNYNRKDKTPPVATIADATNCGDCLDNTFYGKAAPASGTDKCEKRVNSLTCVLDTNFMVKDADTCTQRQTSANCPVANSEKATFEDKCVCKQGYFDRPSGNPPAMTCLKEKTQDECKKLNRLHVANDDKCGACKQFYATAQGAAADAKCDLIEDSKLTQTDCETVLNRVWDSAANPQVCKKECKADHNTDSGALLHACFPNANENDCKKNTDRTFNSAKKLCTCKAPKVANEILEFSSTTAACGNGAMSSVILSASVLVAAVTGSLFYLF